MQATKRRGHGDGSIYERTVAGKLQYVAEQITDIAPGGSQLQQGQVIARYAAHGTAIEYGWSTINGVTLAKATTGYEEGQVTPAQRSGGTQARLQASPPPHAALHAVSGWQPPSPPQN